MSRWKWNPRWNYKHLPITMKRGAIEISFGLIFTLIIIGAVLVIGGYAIVQLMGTLDDTDYITLREDLKDSVSSMQILGVDSTIIYADGGSKKPLRLPKDKGHFCIVNFEQQLTEEFPDEDMEKRGRVLELNALYSERKDNSFLVEDVSPSPNPLCFRMNEGRNVPLSFSLTYLGNKEVQISEVE